MIGSIVLCVVYTSSWIQMKVWVVKVQLSSVNPKGRRRPETSNIFFNLSSPLRLCSSAVLFGND